MMIVGIRQTAAVQKMGVFHSQLLCLFIHTGNEFLFAAGDELRHCDRSIITAGNGDTFDQGIHRLHFPFFQKNLTSAHRLRIGARHHLVLQVDIAFLQRFKNQQQGHDLGDARRGTWHIRILLKNHGSSGSLHQNGRRRRQMHGYTTLLLRLLYRSFLRKELLRRRSH